MENTPRTIPPPKYKTITVRPEVPAGVPPGPPPIRPVTFQEINYIVTGPASEITTLVQQVSNTRQVESYLVAELDLGYLQPVLSGNAEIPWYYGMDPEDKLVMRLYKVIGAGALPVANPPWEQTFIDEIRSKGAGKHVHVDLDYLVDGVCGDPWTGEGSPFKRIGGPKTADGDPWTGEGSPWTGEGSPWTGEGSPWARWALFGLGLVFPCLAKKRFIQQWAFADPPGVDLFNGSARNSPYTGKGVRVGIFDTSPERYPGHAHYKWAAQGGLDLTIKQLDPFWHQGIYAAANEVNYLIQPPFEPDDHGLFVAGLVHGVAPDSDIHLYRVLDRDGKGDLFTLNYALHTFIKETLEQKAKLAGAVINLSLGSSSLALPRWTIKQLARSLLEPVSLHTLLTAAHMNGIVVTAASGNHGHTFPDYEAPQNPAQSPDCLAVAASDRSGLKACFSQDGNVCAPGGKGADPGCKLPAPQESSKQWLMSLVYKPHTLSEWLQQIKGRKWGQLFFPGYAYAAGTSFATPLVSGLAALAIDAQSSWPAPGVIAADIKGATWSNPNPGANTDIVNVTNTLS